MEINTIKKGKERVKRFWQAYKTPLIVSITLFIVLMALTGTQNVVEGSELFLGVLLGTFVLDLDYIIYAFLTDPDTEFSQNLRSFIKHKDVSNTLNYIGFHKDEVTEKTLHSILFQIALGCLTLFAAYSPLNYFTKGLVLSTYANTIYRLSEAWVEGKHGDWFWALKQRPSRNGVKMYIIANVVLLVITLIAF